MSISKAQAYRSRIFCPEYDMQGMLEAFGAKRLHRLIAELERGNYPSRAQMLAWADQADYQFLDTFEPTTKLIAQTKEQRAKARKQAAKRRNAA